FSPERKRELDGRWRLKAEGSRKAQQKESKHSRRTIMARRTPRPQATHAMRLTPLQAWCEQCGQPLQVGDHSHRTAPLVGWALEAEDGGASLYPPGVSTLPYGLSSRRRRTVGAPARGMWLGDHCLD